MDPHAARPLRPPHRHPRRPLRRRAGGRRRKYLVGLGADARNIKVVSYGKERPADPGHNEAAWAKNRRAELTAGAGQ